MAQEKTDKKLAGRLNLTFSVPVSHIKGQHPKSGFQSNVFLKISPGVRKHLPTIMVSTANGKGASEAEVRNSQAQKWPDL